MPHPPTSLPKRHSFRPLMFVVPQELEVAPNTLRSSPPPPHHPAQAPAPRRREKDSHVRLRADVPAFPPVAPIVHLDAQDLLDELCEDQLTLSMNLACLERVVEEAPRDASARAAIQTLELRLVDMAALRDALAAVQTASVDPRLQRLYATDSVLADYLRGVYAWGHAIVRALDQLASSLRVLSPDWAMLRWRIEEARNFHFDELQEQIRTDVVALSIVANGGSLGSDPPDVAALQHALESLFTTTNAVEQHLDERFG